MKRRSRCGETKPYSEFHLRNNRGDGCQVWCKACVKAYDHEYYLKSAARHAQGRRAWKIASEQSMRGLKTGKPCVDCRVVFPAEAMHWDHLPGAMKLGEVSNLMRHHGRKAALEEIAKCELVCANCHAIRTYNRLHEAMAIGA